MAFIFFESYVVCFGVWILSNVYKYFPQDRKSFLEDFLIRFTPPADLNDPYECLPAFDDAALEIMISESRAKIDERLSCGLEASEIKEIAELIFDKMRKDAFEKIDSKEKVRALCYMVVSKIINSGLGILSLSKRWDSALMWSHYTSSYSGFCVGFDSGHPYFSGSKNYIGDRSGLLSVKYEKNRFVVPSTDLSDEDVHSVLLAKSMDWQYEDEVRLVSVLSLADKRILKDPYPVDLFEIPRSAISEVIIGSRAGSDLLEQAKSTAKALNVKIYQTKVSDTSYDIERVEMVV